MNKIKLYISLIAIISIISIIIAKPQYIEEGIKALISVMECEVCFSE